MMINLYLTTVLSLRMKNTVAITILLLKLRQKFTLKNRFLIGKDKITKWQKKKCLQNVKKPSRNIISILPGVMQLIQEISLLPQMRGIFSSIAT